MRSVCVLAGRLRVSRRSGVAAHTGCVVVVRGFLAGRPSRRRSVGRMAMGGRFGNLQAKTKCPRLEFSNEMEMDFVLSQV